MIQLVTQWVDVSPFLQAKTPPVFLMRREPAHSGPKAWAGQTQIGTMGEFWVPDGNVLASEMVVRPSLAGDAVRIPMGAYLTTHKALPAIFALGVQVGLEALVALRKCAPDPIAMHLIIGHECTELADAFQCYIGIAFQTK